MASEGAAGCFCGCCGRCCGWSCGCGGGLLQSRTLPSSDTWTVREGSVLGGGEISCCVPKCWLDQPTTPKGEAGGWGWWGFTLPALACLDPSTPWKEEGWCWAGRSRSIKPWPHKGGGWEMGEGGELEMTAHHECWLVTKRELKLVSLEPSGKWGHWGLNMSSKLV